MQSLFDSRVTRHLLSRNFDRPLVVTCWGSDVLRNQRKVAIRRNRSLLQRANVITYSGDDFGNAIAERYGEDLRTKMLETYFDPNQEVLQTIYQARSTDVDAFGRQVLGVEPDDLCVCVGHSASPFSRHEKILDALSRWRPNHGQRVCLVLPMTYGAVKAYLRRVQLAAKSSPHVAVVLTDYLSDRQIGLLRRRTDVLAYFPDTDAFSATVTQALASRSVVVTGDWLPYSTRRRQGFRYWTINSIDGLSAKMTELSNIIQHRRGKLESNERLTRSIFSPATLAAGWIDAFRLASASLTAMPVRGDQTST